MFSELQLELYVSTLSLESVKYLTSYEIQGSNRPYLMASQLTLAFDHLYSAVAIDQNDRGVMEDLVLFQDAITEALDIAKKIRASRVRNQVFVDQIKDDAELMADYGELIVKYLKTHTIEQFVEATRNANVPTMITILNNRYKAFHSFAERPALRRKTVKALNNQNRPRH